MKKSQYVVWQGKQTGVFDSWAKVAPLVTGVQGARFKGFYSKEVAEQAFARPWQEFIDTTNKKKEASQPIAEELPIIKLPEAVASEEVEFQDSIEPPW